MEPVLLRSDRHQHSHWQTLHCVLPHISTQVILLKIHLLMHLLHTVSVNVSLALKRKNPNSLVWHVGLFVLWLLPSSLLQTCYPGALRGMCCEHLPSFTLSVSLCLSLSLFLEVLPVPPALWSVSLLNLRFLSHPESLSFPTSRLGSFSSK